MTLEGLRIRRIADGVRLAYRPGTIDEEVIRHGFATADLSSSEYQPGPADVILDVGAHIGTFALRVAKRVPDGRVFAVEASQESYEVLTINALLNDAGNVVADHMALSDRSGPTQLHHDDENWGHTITLPLGRGGEPVEGRSLADYLDAREIDRCDFAKLNCEGAEFPILMGASAQTLSRIRQLLVFYHLDLVDDERYRLEALELHLREAGFDVQRIQHSRTRGRLVTAGGFADTLWSPRA